MTTSSPPEEGTEAEGLSPGIMDQLIGCDSVAGRPVVVVVVVVVVVMGLRVGFCGR